MKIKFLKDFMATQSDDFRDLHAILIKRGGIVDVDGCEYNNSYFDMPKEQAQWLIDNGFAEEVKEPEWVRKQIKQVLFDDNQLTDNESVWVKMRFLKDFYFEKTDIRGIKHYKAGYELEKVLFKEEREILLPQTIYYINQLVRDGYIEIQDSPNIVWEDEK